MKPVWNVREVGTSIIHPTVTLRSCTFHYLGTKVTPSNLSQMFLSVCSHATDYDGRWSVRSTAVTYLCPVILQQIADLLHQHNPRVRYFVSLCNWTKPLESSNNFLMTIHANKKPSQDHVRECSWSTCYELAAHIPEADAGIMKGQNVFLQRSGLLGVSGNDKFNSNSIIVPMTLYTTCLFCLMIRTDCMLSEHGKDFCKIMWRKEDVFFNVLLISTSSQLWSIQHRFTMWSTIEPVLSGAILQGQLKLAVLLMRKSTKTRSSFIYLSLWRTWWFSMHSQWNGRWTIWAYVNMAFRLYQWSFSRASKHARYHFNM